MEQKELLLKRLNEIGESVKNTGSAVALLGLGSVGIELDRLDNYSDLDFFVIVKGGYKNKFIENIDWLENIKPVVFKFRNTKDGYKIMYEDGIYCEFAVFEADELEHIPYAEGRLVWHDENFDSSLRVPKNSGAPQWKPESEEWLIGEIITCIYVGLCRYNRGEMLSGFRFVQGHALNLFLELIEMTKTSSNSAKDIYSVERRFEERYPGHEDMFNLFLQGYTKTKDSAKEIINYMDSNYSINQAMKNIILDLC